MDIQQEETLLKKLSTKLQKLSPSEWKRDLDKQKDHCKYAYSAKLGGFEIILSGYLPHDPCPSFFVEIKDASKKRRIYTFGRDFPIMGPNEGNTERKELYNFVSQRVNEHLEKEQEEITSRGIKDLTGFLDETP